MLLKPQTTLNEATYELWTFPFVWHCLNRALCKCEKNMRNPKYYDSIARIKTDHYLLSHAKNLGNDGNGIFCNTKWQNLTWWQNITTIFFVSFSSSQINRNCITIWPAIFFQVRLYRSCSQATFERSHFDGTCSQNNNNHCWTVVTIVLYIGHTTVINNETSTYQ